MIHINDVKKWSRKKNINKLIRILKFEGKLDYYNEIFNDKGKFADYFDEKIVYEALNGLEKISDVKIVKKLLKIIPGFKAKGLIINPVERIIINIGSSATKPLIELSYDNKSDVRDLAVGLLAQIGDKNAIEHLIKALYSKNEKLRTAAAIALGKIKNSNAVEPLVRMLHSGDRKLSIIAANVLGNINDVKVIEALSSVLDNKDSEISRRAAESLHKLGWKPTKDENGAWYYIRMNNFDKCLEIGEDSIGPLVKILISGHPFIHKYQKECAIVLNKLGWKPMNEQEMVLYYIRLQDFAKCVEIGAPAVRTLTELLDDDDESIRRRSASALQTIYHSGRLDNELQDLILKQKGKIISSQVLYKKKFVGMIEGVTDDREPVYEDVFDREIIVRFDV